MPFPSVGQSTLTTTILNPYSAVSTNPIINGDGSIAQRGTTIAGSINTNAYTLDRWRSSMFGVGVFTTAQVADAPAVAAIVPVSPVCIGTVVTTADASIAGAGADFYSLRQSIEGYLWAPFAQRQFTLGFWVRATVTGIYCISFRNAGTDRFYVAEYTVNNSLTWEYKTITVSASPSAGTWDYINGSGLIIDWIIADNDPVTAGVWTVGNHNVTSNQVNGMSAINNIFRLWGVTMGLGPTVQPYFPRPYITELAMCQRYCSVSNPYSLAVAPVAVGLCTGTNSTRVEHPLPQPMRGVPTSAVASGNFDIYFNASVSPIVTIPVNVLGDRMVEFLTTHTGGLLTTGAGAILFTHDTTSKITVSAEL